MREYEEYKEILALWELGIPKKRIGLTLGIPRATVRDCIERYGSVQGLEEHKLRAVRSTPDATLQRIQNPEDQKVQKAYAYVLGIYLGDGYIVRNKRIYFLRVFLDDRYPEIIDTCVQKIQILLPENKVNVLHSTRGNYVEVVSTYKFWPALLPQHGEGRKHEREVRLEDWQMQIVDRYPLETFRGLYHSDGSRFNNVVKGKAYPRYQFTNNAPGIIQLFCYTCNLLGVHWTSKTRNSPKDHATDIFISRREDVAFLDQHVGPKR
jgi:hypothetical protein